MSRDPHQARSESGRPAFAISPSSTVTDFQTAEALLECGLSLELVRRGKVRDVYRLPPSSSSRPGDTGRLLIVATDRISAFDVVMPTPIPGKGALLTEISTFWLRFIEGRGLSGTHLLSVDVQDVPTAAYVTGGTRPEQLRGRVTIGRLCRVIPIECVVRGYLEGSGWKDYQQTGSVCGVMLPKGLRQCDQLPEPIFTPATKEEQGRHDENVSFERAAELVGRELMETLRRRTLSIYAAAAEEALGKGIIIADTKFEFGLPLDAAGNVLSHEPIVVDEALTPDSSRFWPADRYEPGRPQASFDKQYLREYLQSLVDAGKWNKQAPGPDLPADVARSTAEKYREARDRLVAAAGTAA
jgi:phosphoribosylaminoimidazole-succinocarboxamide synthase